MSAMDTPATFAGKSSVISAKKGPYGIYILTPAIPSSANDSQKLPVPVKYKK